MMIQLTGVIGKGALFRPMVSEYAIWYDTGYRRLTCMFSEFIHHSLLFLLLISAFSYRLSLISYQGYQPLTKHPKFATQFLAFRGRIED